MGFYGFLDRAPKGRDEGDPPEMWSHRHDEYEDASWAELVDGNEGPTVRVRHMRRT